MAVRPNESIQRAGMGWPAGEPTTPHQKQRHDAPGKEQQGGSRKQLLLGLVFGLAFGFLLQKGGVAKYHVLVGQLLLEDFTVVKVMLTAIGVGMVGIYTLHALGVTELHVPATRYGANILGGLIFGAGFGLIAYCPGTAAAALGQGNLDALVGILGLMAGSYLFAEVSGWLDRTVNRWGDRGTLTLPQLFGVPTGWFIARFVPLLVLALLLPETYSPR